MNEKTEKHVLDLLNDAARLLRQGDTLIAMQTLNRANDIILLDIITEEAE